LVVLFAAGAAAQTTASTDTVPILSGGVAFVPTVEGGQTSLNTVVAPVLLVPFGEKWLFESRATFEGDFERENGSFVGPVGKQVDYLELDYLANKYLTVTAGRFLTPFGIYNERLYPVWVRNLQTEPLILPMEESSSNGLMFRGGFAVNKNVVLNYAAYFSALTTNQFLYADRQYGSRVGIFLPKQRVEVGFSFQHKLIDEQANVYGVHFIWQPRQLPLDIRTEFAHSNEGHGYWIEPAFKLTSLHKWHALTSKTQLVGRFQQFFVKGAPEPDSEFPLVNTRQAEFGLNYYIMDGLRLTASTGRQFSSDGNHNVWTAGVTYRFAFPLGRGGAR
jgi:hypothetical protein